MNDRERFMRILRFESVDYVPNMEWGPMEPSVVREWRKQGLPEGVGLGEFFGLVGGGGLGAHIYEPMPGVPDQGVIHEDDTKQVIRDCWGRVTEWYKGGGGVAENARHDLEPGLRSRQQWELLRDHFRADEPLRLPGQWDPSHPPLYVLHAMSGPAPYQKHCGVSWQERVERWRDRDHWLQLEAPSMMGQIKEVMGFENYCFMLYDDREMIEEIMEARTALAERLIDRILDEVDFDILHFWEDIAFNGGPMVSPEIFEELALPRYRRLIALFRSKGAEVVSIDSDGDMRSLIPGLLRAGVNHLWPVEYNAGMDVAELRREYGHAFTMRGGIDKYALLKGRDAIDRELDRIAPVVQDGGYVPMLDHQIPSGIPFEDFCYYMEKKRQLLGTPPEKLPAALLRAGALYGPARARFSAKLQKSAGRSVML